MLTNEQVSQYHERGFCLAPNFLSHEELTAFLKEIETISAGATLASHRKDRLEMEPNQPPEGTLVRRIYEPCSCYDLFKAFSESNQLVDAVEQLIGANVLFHYSKINMKPPAIGSIVRWHQDLAYYPLTNRDSLAVLFYLDDADRNNGCLRIVAGSNKGRAYDHTRDGYFQGEVTEPVEESQAVFIEGRAGSAIFMNCMALHASSPNHSPRARRTLILSYRAADAFPIYIPEMTVDEEVPVRLVRGERCTVARFDMTSFPIPRYPRQIKSLYELQELSRAVTKLSPT